MFSKFKNVVERVEAFFFYLSCLLFMLMMFIGAFDVLGRYLFNRPIRGTMEISAVMMGAIVFFSWAFTQRDDGHVKVELVVSYYSDRMRSIANCFTLSLSLVLFILIAYKSTLIAIRSFTEHRTLPILEIPTGPLHALVPIGAVLLCLTLLIQIVSNIATLRKG